MPTRSSTRNNALILYIDLPESKRFLHDKAALNICMKGINKKYPQTHIDLFYIKQNLTLQDGEIIYTTVGDYVSIAECYNKPREEGAPAHHCNFNNTVLSLDHVKLRKSPEFSVGSKEIRRNLEQKLLRDIGKASE